MTNKSATKNLPLSRFPLAAEEQCRGAEASDALHADLPRLGRVAKVEVEDVGFCRH